MASVTTTTRRRLLRSAALAGLLTALATGCDDPTTTIPPTTEPPPRLSIQDLRSAVQPSFGPTDPECISPGTTEPVGVRGDAVAGCLFHGSYGEDLHVRVAALVLHPPEDLTLEGERSPRPKSDAVHWPVDPLGGDFSTCLVWERIELTDATDAVSCERHRWADAQWAEMRVAANTTDDITLLVETRIENSSDQYRAVDDDEAAHIRDETIAITARLAATPPT